MFTTILQLLLNVYIYIAKKLPKDVNKRSVFACNELDLDEIQVYGFDYDYTLACYKKSLHYLLYNLGRDMLIEKFKVNSLWQFLSLTFFPSIVPAFQVEFLS